MKRNPCLQICKRMYSPLVIVLVVKSLRTADHHKYEFIDRRPRETDRERDEQLIQH